MGHSSGEQPKRRTLIMAMMLYPLNLGVCCPLLRILYGAVEKALPTWQLAKRVNGFVRGSQAF
jgi:hypothetical protein